MNKHFQDSLISILDKVKISGATKAVVAGGAIRDSLLHKSVRDVDVFYTGDLNKTILHEQFPSLKDLEGFILQEALPEGYPQGDFQVTHPSVWMDEFDYEIQLIQVEDIDKAIDSFGCGLSQISFDGMTYKVTEKWQHDHEKKVLTWINNPDEKYKKKIKLKYPEYSWEEKEVKKLRYLNRVAA